MNISNAINTVSDNIKNASENVLAIFTQDWCGDWKGLERELKANEEKSPVDITIFLYYITEGAVQIIRRYLMRLEKVQEALKTKKIHYELQRKYLE